MLALERWKPRRGAKPASPSELAAQRAGTEGVIATIEAEMRQIEEVLAELTATDPEHAAEAQLRLTELSVELPTKRRTLALIESEVEKAEKREARSDLERRIAQRIADRDRFARTLRAEYERAANAFNAVLAKIEADDDACERITNEAREAGLYGVPSAEFTLRGSFTRRQAAFESLAAVKIGSWEGGFGFPIRHTR